jgi:hypothetical protein
MDIIGFKRNARTIMKKRIVVFIIIIASLLPASSFARGGGHRSEGHASGSYSHSSRSNGHSAGSHIRKSKYTAAKEKRSARSLGVTRDSGGKIKRSAAAKKEFLKETGYPNGRPGYVVDHVTPLKRGGADSPSNMQWQTKEAAKAKDKWE